MKGSAEIRLKIKYDKISSRKDLQRTLEYAINYLAGEGLLSNEDSTVKEWSSMLDITIHGETYRIENGGKY